MKPDLEEISEVSQALDYLTEQTYTDDERATISYLFEQRHFDADLDALKDSFPGKRGIISRLRTICRFAQKYKDDKDLMDDLVNEIDYLVSVFNGESGGSIGL